MKSKTRWNHKQNGKQNKNQIKDEIKSEIKKKVPGPNVPSGTKRPIEMIRIKKNSGTKLTMGSNVPSK